jgi:hypothetical protein
MLEEYGPELRYIKGEQNVVADALSRLDMLASHPESDEEIAELLAADTSTWAKAFPLAYRDIETSQSTDAEIQKLILDKPEVYKESEFPCGSQSRRKTRLSCLSNFNEKQLNGTTVHLCIREKPEPNLLWHSITPGRVCEKQYRMSARDAAHVNSISPRIRN